MIRKRNDNKRSFSYTEPILYRGEAYPSTKVYMDNGSGMAEDGTMFVDKDGQYYSMGKDGNAYPTLLQHNLPEVEVKPSQEEMLSRSLRNSLILSQDKARVSNPLNPYESFNSHLRERALRGAREHGLWDKEHPNLAAWRDFGTAIPFGVAAAPLVGGLGETALGQAAINGAEKIISKPAVKAMDSALGLGFGAKGAYDISQGDVTPSTLLELTGIYPGIKAAKGLVSSKKITREPFVSELDWSPESWFKKYRPSYSQEDAIALESHIPEYHSIEQQTKANGTWLQMPDGTTWEGDPRGWVMYKSKNVRNNYRNEVLSHGEDVYFGPDKMSFNTDANGNDISGEVLGTKPIWTSTNPKTGATYGDDIFPIVIPKDANIQTVADAQGRGWGEVLPGATTDDLVYPKLTENNVIRINNVVDPGSKAPSLMTKAKDALPNETVPDYFKRKYLGDDLVLGKNVRRKSLYGNNGNFVLSSPDIYKGLIPLIFGTPTAFSFNQTNR